MAEDGLKAARTAAGIVPGVVFGIALTDDGRLALLPGLPTHPELTAGSPALAEATEQLADGAAYATFLRPAPDADGPAPLVRVSVLAVRGVHSDGVRAVVVVAPAPDVHGLSAGDLQILGFVVADRPDEEIAAALGIPRSQVAERIDRAMRALGATSRTGLVVRALREGCYLPRRASTAG